MAINNVNLEPAHSGFPFPKDNVSPRVKEKDEYGVKIGKAIWGYASMHDANLFYNDRDMYDKYRRYALGKQDQSQYKPLLNEESGTKKQNWLKAINFEIKNYATKRINIVTAKMRAKDYDVTVEMTDPVSRGILENVKLGLRTKMKYRREFEEMNAVFGDMVDVNSIPQNEDELNIVMENDFKMLEAEHLEKAIPYHLTRNRFKDIRRNVDFCLAVLGVGAIYDGLDENMRPVLEYVPPDDILIPYNEQPDFDNLAYIAQIKWVSIAEFRKIAHGYLSDNKIEEIVQKFAKNQYDSNETRNNSYYDSRQYDDVSRIALLRYNYRSTDTMVYLQKPDEMGNMVTYEKPVDYYSKPKEMERFNKKYKGQRQIHRMSVNAVYEGFWVIGSETVFRHGRRAYNKEKYGVFQTNGMGFKLFAPNSWNGMVTSLGAQMIPQLDELQRYNLKVQQLVARAIPKGVGVDLYALRKANLKWNGKGMTDQEKIEMFMKSGIFVFSSKDRYAAGSNYRPFYEVENGLANDIEKYLRLTQNALLELDEIIGINKVVAASNVREDAGKAVTEMQVGASETALDYLYDADRTLYERVVESVGLSHIKSYKYSEKNRMLYNAMFGAGSGANMVLNFDTYDVGFDIQARPTEAEWREVYLSAEKAYDKGIISYSDTLYLREFNSIKQARIWLMMKEREAIRKAQENAQQNAQMNAQEQQASAMAKSQATIQEKQAQHQMNMAEKQFERETYLINANVDLSKAEKLTQIESANKRRLEALSGKIKDRHIEAEGDIDKAIELIRLRGRATNKENDNAKTQKSA